MSSSTTLLTAFSCGNLYPSSTSSTISSDGSLSEISTDSWIQDEHDEQNTASSTQSMALNDSYIRGLISSVVAPCDDRVLFGYRSKLTDDCRPQYLIDDRHKIRRIREKQRRRFELDQTFQVQINGRASTALPDETSLSSSQECEASITVTDSATTDSKNQSMKRVPEEGCRLLKERGGPDIPSVQESKGDVYSPELKSPCAADSIESESKKRNITKKDRTNKWPPTS